MTQQQEMETKLGLNSLIIEKNIVRSRNTFKLKLGKYLHDLTKSILTCVVISILSWILYT